FAPVEAHSRLLPMSWLSRPVPPLRGREILRPWSSSPAPSFRLFRLAEQRPVPPSVSRRQPALLVAMERRELLRPVVAQQVRVDRETAARLDVGEKAVGGAERLQQLEVERQGFAGV